MRRAAKVDRNQAEIVQALRAIGATVQHLHFVGRGCPDLLVGYRGKSFLLEVKFGKAKLNPREQRWFDEWEGHAAIVRDVYEAIDEVTNGH